MKLRSVAKLFVVLIVAFGALLAVRSVIDSTRFTLPAPLGRLLQHPAADSASTPPLSRFEANLFAVLRELEVKEEQIDTRFFLEDTLREIHAAIPRGRPIEWIIWHVTQSTERTAYEVVDCVLDQQGATCRVTFHSTNPKDPTTVLTISRATRFFSTVAKMAIFLRGFDFEADKTTMDILSFPEPLTLALVPDRRKAGWTAQAATEYNKEIVIAIPLESHSVPSTKAPSPMIKVHHAEEKIRDTMDELAKIIPRFSGFCNLFGSRACEDSRVMGIVLDEVSKRHGYFVDTRTTRSSTVAELASVAGVPYAEVGASVDDGHEPAHSEELLRHYCLVAQKRGKLLLSAPASQAFVSALYEVRDVLRQNGVRLVHVSEIVSQPSKK